MRSSLEAASRILPPEYQQPAEEKLISILTGDHISYFPRKLLKWNQEQVSEGQDEKTRGQRD